MQTDIERRIIAELTRRQRQARLSDLAFARELAVSRTLWREARVGTRRLSEALQRGIINRYPDLTPDVLFILSGKGLISTAAGTIGTPAA